MIKISDSIYMHTGSCNVYLLKSGNSAVLIDFGRGEILKHIKAVGVEQIECILHTHHHREQCQGDQMANNAGIPIAVPEREALLFNHVEYYWNTLYSRKWDCNGAPYVRPLISSITTDRELSEGDTLSCGALTISVIDTPGHSPGGISLIVEADGMKIAFTGDLLMDGGKIINLYDSEWDYGYGAGLKTLAASCRKLAALKPDILLPSHGGPVNNATEQCQQFSGKLEAFIEQYYIRDYGTVSGFENPAATTPSIIPEADEVSPHIIRWKDNFGNMYIILGEDGAAILVDAGIIHYEDSRERREEFLGTRLDQLIKHYNIRKIEAVILTHYHGDHLDILYFVLKRYGAKLWCYENMVEVIEHPRHFNLTCLLPWYGIPGEFTVDRVLRNGECVEWGGYRLDIFHLPGQTWYAMGMAAEIDGEWNVFSGDNLFCSAKGSGHDAFVMRNRSIPEEGYIQCAETLKRLKPDRILCGHSILIEEPAVQLELFQKWAYEFRNQLTSFSPYKQYEYLIDPYWVEIYPYRTRIKKEREIKKYVKVRNHTDIVQMIKGELCCPDGWEVLPGEFDLEVEPGKTAFIEISVKIPEHTDPGRYPVTADIRIDGADFGQLCDGLVEVDI